MANIRRLGLTSLFPFVVLLCHLLCLLHAAHADAIDFPTAGISTGWSTTPTREHAISYQNRWAVRSPLLRRSREESGPSYACGFYSLSSPNVSFNYFAIMIIQVMSSGDGLAHLSSIPQVVWKANTDRAVSENATLQLGSHGGLVLTDDDGTKVWSTDTSGKSVSGMNLTEYGNLVLFGDGGNDIVWDSFDHPTDSLVPGQKLRIGQSLQSGNMDNYSLSATPTGLMAFSKTDPPTRYACILTTDNTRKVEYFEFMNGSFSTTLSRQYMPPSQFLRLQNDGNLDVYKWNSTLVDQTFDPWDINTIMEFRDHSYCSVSFFPIAGISTSWMTTPMMADIVQFTDGSQVRSHLLRRREDAGPAFSCGFYCKRPCNSFLFAIIIFSVDSSGNILLSVEPQVVWVANRGHPVGVNATLRLGSDGDLVLTDSDGAKAWSTDTSGKSVSGMNLTECGNLVLFGGNKNDTIVWESFAHPTDSLVPTQKLSVGQRLTANESPTNSTEGPCYLYANSTGLIPYVNSNPPTMYSLPVPDRFEGRTEHFEFMNLSITTSSSSAQCMPRTDQFLRLESDGRLRVYHWSPTNATWDATEGLLYSIASRSTCFYPMACGRYGICSGNEVSCRCPQWDDSGSNYFRPIDDQHPRLGCKEVIPLSCQSPYNHTLLRLDNTSYFSHNFNDPDIRDTTEVNCRDACQENCSCKAAFFRRHGIRYYTTLLSGDCYLANEVFSLRDNQEELFDSSGSVVFIKVQIPVSQEHRTPKVLILGLTLGALFLLILLVGAFILVGRRKMNKERDASAQLEEEEEDLKPLSGMPKRFSFDELRAATDNFCRKIGQGGFGSVYEGIIDAKAIAVKCLEGAGQGRKEFLAEVQTIGKIHHVNLVKLIGYCAEKSRRLLVYEFMPNGSLDGWIFSKDDQKGSLDWQMRRKIILGVAKGLSYLHEDCSQRIAHLDIKPHNILLDDKFEAKISDFGLAKLIDRDLTHVQTGMRGTAGYLAPEWLSSKITEKADVYSFGVVVLEMICGRRNLDRSESEEGMMLVSLLKKKAENNELVDLVDETIKNTDFHGEVMKMMKTVMWCLQDQKDRPSMSTVVKILEGAMDIESNLEDMFRAVSTVECNDGIDASSCTPILASVLSGPR